MIVAAPTTACECGALIRPDSTKCDQREAEDGPELGDDEVECSSCEEVVPYDEVDEELVCQSCQEEAEHRRQLESDYRFWTR